METLNKLTTTVTASPTWADLVAKMRAGYCPTIRLTSRRARLLDRAIRASGFRTFNG